MKLRELLGAISAIAKTHNISTPFICGGAVREKVMGSLTKLGDIDITTGDASVKNLAKEVELELSKKFSITSKTMDDGHTSIFLEGLKVDFSSNFILPDIDRELNKLNVKNPTDLIREAYSRDFTCNSLLMNFDLQKITDPTGRGISDIKNKLIKTCVSPEITLKYNLNRIIRVIYLSAKLDFDIDSEIIDFIKTNKDLISHIDSGYITNMLNKSIKYNIDRTAKVITDLDLWQSIPLTEELYPYFKSQKTNKTAQLKKNFDYTDGFYSNMTDYKSVSDYRKKNKKKRKKIIKKIKDMKLASNRPILYNKLNALRPQFARAAQKIVDSWEQDENGEDVELGNGGICDRIAEALSVVVGQNIRAQVADGGHDGDDHAFIIVYTDTEAFAVNIPPGVYETGGGYVWKKKKNVKINPMDIDIWKINRKDIDDIEKYAYYNGIDDYLTDNFPIVQNDDLQENMDRKENKPENEDPEDGETILEPSEFSPSMFLSMHGDQGILSMPLSEYPGHLPPEDKGAVVNNNYNNIYQFNGLLESMSAEEIASLFLKLSIK